MCFTYFISVIFHSKVLSSKKSRRTIFFNLTILLWVESFPAPSGRSTTYISYITFHLFCSELQLNSRTLWARRKSVAVLLKSTFVDGKTDTKVSAWSCRVHWSMPLSWKTVVGGTAHVVLGRSKQLLQPRSGKVAICSSISSQSDA